VSLLRKAHQKHVVPPPHRKKSSGTGSRFHICRFEQMEERQLLSVSIAPIHVATTYHEDSNNYDQSSVLQGTNTQVADLSLGDNDDGGVYPNHPEGTLIEIIRNGIERKMIRR